MQTNELVSRLKKLEQTRNNVPWAIVTYKDGHTERHSLSRIARAFFDGNPDEITSLSWVSGDTSGAIFQLLACDDFWMEVKGNDTN